MASCHYLVYIHMYMRLMTSDGRFAMANFFQPSQFSVDIHLNSLVIRFFRSQTEKITVANGMSDTCKQPNINEKKEKDRCRKSAVGCRKPHTCVRTLRYNTRPNRKG